MVMKINIPDDCGISLIDSIVEERQRGVNKDFFNAIKNDWKSRVEIYNMMKGNPELIQPWDAIKHKANSFHNLYLHPKENDCQKPILEKLRNKLLSLCPACGEEGTPNTLDHYLPKD